MKKLLILCLLTSLFACKKYDEGGFINKTNKNIVEVWTFDKYFRNGLDETTQVTFSSLKETYKNQENDNFERSYIDKDGKTISEKGTYSFQKTDKLFKMSGIASLEISNSIGSVSSSEFHIKKLTKKEYWYYYQNGSDLHEFHFKK